MTAKTVLHTIPSINLIYQLPDLPDMCVQRFLEDNQERLQQQLYRMFGADAAPALYFFNAAKPLGSGLDQQIETFRREHPDTNLVIIDTLSSPPVAGCSHIRKNFVYFSKNIPRGSFTIKKCFDRIKAQFIHSQSSNAKTVSRYLGEEVA